jgi:hypothetical protein
MKILKNFETFKRYSQQDHAPLIEKKSPMRITSDNIELLKKSIVISLDFPVDRPDLEFVVNSRVDGKPIYRYTGKIPFHLDIPFEELVSLEGIHEIESAETSVELSEYEIHEIESEETSVEHENLQVIQAENWNMSFADKLDRDIHNAIQRIHTSEWDFKPFDRTK